MKKNLPAQVLTLALAVVPAAHASEAELLQRIDKMAAELEQIKAELAATRQKADTVEKKQEAYAATPVPAPPAAGPVTAQAPAGEAAAGPAPAQTVLGGYGEINYNRPTRNASQAQTDVRRAVIGIQHRFDEHTKLVSEFEWEHAIASASDRGESAVEQLYIEHELGTGLRAKAGLFLI